MWNTKDPIWINNVLMSTFRRDRLRELRESKHLQQNEIEGVPYSAVRKIENGHANPSLEVLKQLAVALDATTDYFLGLGENYETPASAAVKMSFSLFERDIATSSERAERCRRVLDHPDAPRTVNGWRSFAEMVELAIGPKPPRIGIAKGA
jgi:transcriptional regulator with XRE-family HTH domain